VELNLFAAREFECAAAEVGEDDEEPVLARTPVMARNVPR
jgi:hypothetical protein